MAEKLLELTTYAKQKFKDVDGHWSLPSIAKLTGLEGINGYPDGTFRPQGTTSAAEFTKLLLAGMGYLQTAAAPGEAFLRAVRAFLYYCMKLDYMKTFTMSLIKAEKKIKETYTDSELKMLLKLGRIKENYAAREDDPDYMDDFSGEPFKILVDTDQGLVKSLAELGTLGVYVHEEFMRYLDEGDRSNAKCSNCMYQYAKKTYTGSYNTSASALPCLHPRRREHQSVSS